MTSSHVVEQVLTLPSLVAFLPFTQLRRLNELSKRFAHLVRDKPETLGYWSAMCLSLAAERGLYTIFDSPNVAPGDYASARRIFFDELWPNRDKWSSSSGSSSSSSSSATNPVKISVRFRPEVRGLDNVNLPLHQFLKVKRAKVQADQQLLVGLEDPAEFLDPLLNTLMHDPVFVPTARRICDRAVAISSILRGGRCPFSGRRLRAEQLEPQEELKARIAAWRVEKEERTRDKSVALEDTKSLVAANTAVDPALLELTTEIERMALIADRAQREQASLLAKRGKGQNGAGNSEDDACISSSSSSSNEGDENAAPNANTAASNHQEDGAVGDLLGAVRAMGGGSIDLAGHDDCGMFSRTADKPRVLDVNSNKKCVSVCEPGAGVTAYHFNQVYDGRASQRDVYLQSCRPALHSALNGLNSTVLCYGQTGSGKTFTLHGPEGSLDQQQEEEEEQGDELTKSRAEEGLLLRALREAMQASAILSLRRGVRVSLSCQYVEIFEETCSCLLSGAKCLVRRDSGEVSGATEAPLSTLADCFEVLRSGQLRKRFASTAMNDHSSRSHTVFILHVLSARTEEEGGATPGEQQGLLCVKSRAVLVDLAGSERVKKSLVAGARLKEAIGINNSLLVLGRVIAALASSAPHVPYLESRLTTLLKSSFGGNSRTHVITCCRQADAFGDETLWSLRFASRCSLISNFSRSIATSAQAAAESLDASLASVKAQLEGMRLRGLDKMESFSKLEASYRGLLLKRSDLQALRS